MAITCAKIHDVIHGKADVTGAGVLVDRLWPRGVAKADVARYRWLKYTAPSPELRTWFHHANADDPELFAEFTQRYREELDERLVNGMSADLEELLNTVEHEDVTLLYASKNREHNHAQVLAGWLEDHADVYAGTPAPGGANGEVAAAAGVLGGVDSHSGARRTVLMTGASRGIGRAIAEDLGRDWRVLVGARTEEAAAEVVAGLPDAQPFVCDLTDPIALSDAVHEAGLDGEVTLDAVVHSAGAVNHARIDALNWDDWGRVFAINVYAVAELTRLLLPALRASQGSVVTINSGAGLHSGAGNAVYAGSKHALTAFTDALREEEQGAIRVTSVHPGRVNTDMQRELRRAEGHKDAEYDGALWAQPASIARAVRLALDMPRDAAVPMVRVTPSGLVGYSGVGGLMR